MKTFFRIMLGISITVVVVSILIVGTAWNNATVRCNNTPYYANGTKVKVKNLDNSELLIKFSGCRPSRVYYVINSTGTYSWIRANDIEEIKP